MFILFDILLLQRAKDDPFDLEEVLSSVSRKQLDELWSSLHQKCASALLHFDDDADAVDMDVSIPSVSTFSQCDNYITLKLPVLHNLLSGRLTIYH